MVIVVLPTTVKIAGVPPKVTEETPVKFWPVMVNCVDPSAAPILVDREVTTGALHTEPV